MIGHVLTEKLLGTDGKHRDGDLTALGEQRLVVSGVLAECPKLLEGIVHRMRPCVKGSKVLPRIFIDPLGVSGELVPEAIEVDALPACTRRSSSGPRKSKCHSIGLRTMLSQSPIPGSGASITTQRVTRTGYRAANA